MGETNIIKAIINIVNNPIYEIAHYARANNRANNMGEALEEYVKDIFAGTVGMGDLTKRNEEISRYFSYLGNQNNPPDSIIRGGDAIEVKKIESPNSSLALNSSYPKAKLFSGSNMITDACKKCEEWDEKDIIYVVGVCRDNVLSSISMVYGSDYAASAEVYERIKTTISRGVNSILDVEFAETNELGRVNRVDPLGITYLRIRGMWGIQNPHKAFSYIYRPNANMLFNFMAVINTEKYNSFAEIKELEDLCGSCPQLEITDVRIKNPNNPAELREAKLVRFSIKELINENS